MPIKPAKDAIKHVLISYVPEFAELLSLYQKNGGWVRLPKEFSDAKERLKVHNYVELYDDEQLAAGLLIRALFSLEQAREFNECVEALSQ